MFLLEMLWNLQQTVGSIYLVWALFSVSIVILFTLNMARFTCLHFYSILFPPSLPILSYVCVWKDGSSQSLELYEKVSSKRADRPMLSSHSHRLPAEDRPQDGRVYWFILLCFFLHNDVSRSCFLSQLFSYPQKAAHCRYSFELCGFHIWLISLLWEWQTTLWAN